MSVTSELQSPLLNDDWQESLMESDVKTDLLINSLQEYEQVAYEAIDLDYFVNEYNQLNYAYIKQGHILWHIWNDCLWKQSHSSFRGFIKSEFNLRWYQARTLVDASRIATLLLSSGFKVLPQSRYQCKVLQLLEKTDIECKIEDVEERIIYIWKYILDNYDPIKITGKLIKEVIASIFPQFIPERTKVDVFLDVDVADKLQNLARDNQSSMNEMVLSLMEEKEEIDSEIENVDVDMDYITKEVLLIDRIKKMCDRIHVDYLSVLEHLGQEDNIKNLFSKNYFSGSLCRKAKDKGLSLEELATRLEVKPQLLVNKKDDIDFILSRDPDGISWEYNQITELFFQRE